MKRKLLTFILAVVLCMSVLAGCGADEALVQTRKPTAQPEAMATAEPIDYNEIYKPVLDEYYDVIKNPYDYDELEEGKAGVIENAKYLDKEAFDEIGYLIKDINEDDVPELIIGASDDYTKNAVYALFAIKDSKPYYVLEGRSRSSYSLIEGGKLYYHGSNGAAYTIFGTYELKPDGELACVDYNFSYERNNDYTDIGFFHNTTGIYEKSASEEMNITDDEFSQMEEELENKTVKLEFVPFKSYTPDGQNASAADSDHEQMAGAINNWVTTDYTSDGSEWVLFVDILSDGTASYKCGPPESEIMVDYKGLWNFDATQGIIIFNMKDRFDGSSFNGTFALGVDGNSLSLKHLSGDTFLYGTKGKTFNFNVK